MKQKFDDELRDWIKNNATADMIKEYISYFPDDFDCVLLFADKKVVWQLIPSLNPAHLMKIICVYMNYFSSSAIDCSIREAVFKAIKCIPEDKPADNNLSDRPEITNNKVQMALLSQMCRELINRCKCK